MSDEIPGTGETSRTPRRGPHLPPPDSFKAAALLVDAESTTRPRLTSRALARQAADLITWRRSGTPAPSGRSPSPVVPGRTAERQRELPRRHVEAGRGDRVAFHWEGEPATPAP